MTERRISVGCPIPSNNRKLIEDVKSCPGFLSRPHCVCATCKAPIPEKGRWVGVVVNEREGIVGPSKIHQKPESPTVSK